MNQERMRCILFQWSEWPMGVGLSSKHWALRSHSFSADQARRAEESASLSANTPQRTFAATKSHQLQFRLSAQTQRGERLGFMRKPSLISSKSFIWLSSSFCGTRVTGLSCLKIGLPSAQHFSGWFPFLLHQSPTVDLIYFILGLMHA